jgi:NTE family protein
MNEPIWRTMTRLRTPSLFVLALFILLGRCVSRPVNHRLTHVDPNPGYRCVTRPQYSTGNEDLLVLAFSGGGTRAAAFSYGVL